MMSLAVAMGDGDYVKATDTITAMLPSFKDDLQLSAALKRMRKELSG